MPLFTRHTKTRTSSQHTSEICVNFFKADSGPAIAIQWTADDKKDYAINLYCDEITALTDSLKLNAEKINTALSDTNKKMRDVLLSTALLTDDDVSQSSTIGKLRQAAREAIGLAFLDKSEPFMGIDWEKSADSFCVGESTVYNTNAGPREIFIQSRKQIDGGQLWVVKMDSWVLGKDNRFHYEQLASARTDKFIANTRFISKESAYVAWKMHEQSPADHKLYIEA